MGQFIHNLFTKESAKRHLVQLAITAGLMVWSYVIISLLTSNWNWFTWEEKYFTDQRLLMSNIVGFSLMFVGVAIAGILTYWNAKKWMLPCLKTGGFHLLGVIPFANNLVPEQMQHSWREEIDNLRTPTSVTTYSDGFGKKFSVDNGMLLIFAIPLGIIKALIKGIGLGVLNLIAAIGIPALSPVLLVLGLIATQLLTDWNITVALIVAIIGVLAVVLVLIAQPIITFIKDKKHATN